MTLRTHIYTSTILSGVIYVITQSTLIAVVSFASGVFIDIDHLFDFLIFSRAELSIKEFFSWCDDAKWEKITLIFHSYELYLLVAIITYSFPETILIGVLFGSGLHLVLDQIGNCYLRKKFLVSPWFYFFSYRLYGSFRKDRLLISI